MLLASSNLIFAQSGFRAGYVLPLSGDTLRGEVDYRGEQRNSLLCRYRPSATGAVVEYQPGQIRAYGFAGGTNYQSKTLPEKTTASAFLEALVLGRAELFHRVDDRNQDRYYIGTAATAPAVQALGISDTTVTRYDETQHRNVTTQQRLYTFRNVLWPIMADCPSVQTTVAKVELKQTSLIKLVSAYNTCINPAATKTFTPKNNSATRISVLGGTHQGTIRVINEANNTEHELDKSQGAAFGVGLDIPMRRFNPRLSLLLQALYVLQNYHSTYVEASPNRFNGDDITNNEVKAELATLRVPLILRYSFMRGRVQPFVEAGFLPSLNVLRDASVRSERPRFQSVDTYVFPVHRFNVGAGLVGAGLSIKAGSGSVQLEMRADRYDGTSDPIHGLALSGTRGLTLLAGYTFGG